MNRILIVSVNWLGDSIMCLPILKALKQKFPTFYIGIMAVERISEIYESCPYVDEVIIFNERRKDKTLKAKLNFIKKLRTKKFDTVFFIQRSFTRILICFLAGISSRIGYKRAKTRMLLTKAKTPPSENMHRQDYYSYLFEDYGVYIDKQASSLFKAQDLSSFWVKSISKIREKHPILIGVNSSANWELKRWPTDYFAKVCSHLNQEFNAAIILVGAYKEKSIVDKVAMMIHGQSYNFCGKTTVKELISLIAECDVFISNDSGPAHLAAALGVSTVAIFGPTSSGLTAPRGKAVTIIKKNIDCEIPCYNKKCLDNICMKTINVEDVYACVKNIIKEIQAKKENQ